MIYDFLNKIQNDTILWHHNFLLNHYKKHKNNATNEKCDYLINAYIKEDALFLLTEECAIEFYKTNNINKRYKLKPYTTNTVTGNPVVCFDNKYFTQDPETGWSVLDYTGREVYDMLLKIRDMLKLETEKNLNNKTN